MLDEANQCVMPITMHQVLLSLAQEVPVPGNIVKVVNDRECISQLSRFSKLQGTIPQPEKEYWMRPSVKE